MTSKQVVLTFNGSERVVDVVPHIDNVVKPGTRVVFIVPCLTQPSQLLDPFRKGNLMKRNPGNLNLSQ